MLALGDSITNGGGELQWGVALQSWALWVARGLGLPYTPHAVDGARVTDVLATQVPAVTGERYDLGCLYIGVNDVRALDWDRDAFERGHRAALSFLKDRCDRVLTATVPLDLGRPRAGTKVDEVNAAIEASAHSAGALVLDLRQFKGRSLLMADHVHPTAFGQIAIAEAALDLLASDGMTVRVRPDQPDPLRDHARRPAERRPDLRLPAREGQCSRFPRSSSGSIPNCLSRRGM